MLIQKYLSPVSSPGLLQSLILPPSAARRREEARTPRAPSRGLQPLVILLLPDLATALVSSLRVITLSETIWYVEHGHPAPAFLRAKEANRYA